MIEKLKKAKRVNKNNAKSIIQKEFIDALFNAKIMKHIMEIIQRILHRIGLIMSVRLICLVSMIEDTY